MSNLNIDDFADIALPIHTMSLIQLQASTTINTMDSTNHYAMHTLPPNNTSKLASSIDT